ncbi:family 10 glycosylhydrolase [Hymenobacter sp. RP-2-7]|uniref:Family 10 glycosylhydrolase n=1 Tax=Hymenobacter polaris TaxID=2682546 RepID=A0A7Y0AIB0_9BACT|nr:family 10 glycosylhydrolase [Hymenobacter polaris]NML67837.1 family 10 glycosylhydrolase [Hymenobacter polaris]
MLLVGGLGAPLARAQAHTLTELAARQEADDGPPPPKRELRGFWIATVGNIDWPNQRGEAPEQYRREYRRLLDAGQRAGLNAVFVQIRPASDAFYKSGLEPWSKYLTGRQGKAPAGDDDPLLFLISEAHRHNMEFHAWFNPYRATMDTVTRSLGALHPYRRHPDWFIRYASQYYYNPGLPDVRRHIERVILDVTRRYDIDGVHFDDYFYPYPEPGYTFHDEAAYKANNPDSLSLGDWRRRNVNLLVHELHDSLRATKRWVKFGISPFGVWMNKSADPLGSDTRAGQPSYSNLYADSRLWLQQGWVDYILPQLYWSTRFRLVPYAPLLEWWTRNRFGRHLYIGHGTYRMFESTRSDTAWRNPRELPRQLRLNRSYPEDVQGSVFFSAKSLVGNPLHSTDSLRLDLYRAPALVPTMPWLDSLAPRPVRQLLLNRVGPLATLTWTPDPQPAPDGDRAAYYVLYRFERGQVMGPDDPRRILAIIRPLALGQPGTYQDTTAVPGTAYAYYLTAADRLHNESAPVRIFSEGKLANEVLAAAPPTVAPPVAARPAPRPTAPVVVAPRPQPRPAAEEPAYKVKTKEKEKPRRRGFFARLFGLR